MTDPDFDDFHAMMSDAQGPVDAAAKARNIALAEQNFDTLQGSADASRQTSSQPKNGRFEGMIAMFNTLTGKGGLTVTTALVAAGFLFVTPQDHDLMQRGSEAILPEVKQEARGTRASRPGETSANIDGSIQAELDTTDEARLTFSLDADVEVTELAPMETPASPNALNAEIAEQSIAQSRQNIAPSAGLTSDMPQDIRRTNTETYPASTPSRVIITQETPVSTFSIDVDTASYSVLRSGLSRGQIPRAGSIRIEEMINYFPYDYAAPSDNEAPFRATANVIPTPWNANTQLLHIGVQGRMPATNDLPPLNLVFLIDTSGSMSQPDKLPLLVNAFGLMLNELRPEDEVSIVTYAGSAGQVLAPTSAADTAKIRAALARLSAGGSTAGQSGLEQAYATAEAMSEDGEVTRVILATDGDFNVGISDADDLENYIKKKRKSGTYLSVLGFGRGNLNDATMQTLAQNGNGTAAYIGTLSEAQKVLVDQLSGAVFPIANDVKIQVEFNPSQVAEYRLIGYETRNLNREDFNNDRVDAGDIGAGHSVTAIYEITPVGSPAQLSDPLRYGSATAAEISDEIAFLRLRYKEPGSDTSELIETPISSSSETTQDAQFAAAIAGFGQLLTGARYLGDWDWDDAITLATEHRGEDSFGHRSEAVQLMRLAASLSQ
jgi:Ca-activated chloride channel family protein